MKIFKVLALLACLFVLPAGKAQTAVPINNPSFEIGLPTNPNWNFFPISGWTCTGTGGEFAPTSSQVSSGKTGLSVLWVDGGASCSQDVGPIIPNAIYTLTYSVGGQPQYGVPSGYSVSLGLPGCTLSGNPPTTVGVLVVQTLTCTAGASGELIITLANSGTQVLFDNLNLAFTSTVVLPTVTLGINSFSKAIYDDLSAILPGSITVSQLQNPTSTVGIGTITSDSAGNLSGSLTINPNWIDANGNLIFLFGLPLVPNVISYPVPVGEFQHGSTGLTINLVLFKQGPLAIKSQTLAVTP